MSDFKWLNMYYLVVNKWCLINIDLKIVDITVMLLLDLINVLFRFVLVRVYWNLIQFGSNRNSIRV